VPVLSKRLLVTETLPLYMPGEGSKEFKFEKMLNNHSATLTNESITVELHPTRLVCSTDSALSYAVSA
jgi:hypothetical protein